MMKVSPIRFQQLLTLKGDYETVKSKYEELVRPARTALGKYIAEVYYVKGQDGDVIRVQTSGKSLASSSHPDYHGMSITRIR